jgi:hypothetical protein
MMGRALLIIGALATLAFLASGVLGYLLAGRGDAGLQRHMLLALGACLGLVFAHCWILLYLIGTGRAIRQTVQEARLEPFYVEETGRLLWSVAPWLLATLGLAVATFLLGGAVTTGAVRPLIHHILFFVSLAVQIWILWREHRVLRTNQALIDEIDRRLVSPGAERLGQEVAG